jgi:7,8-dihydropterin-6-yl-methyl-4-(beta-D-ribofuranosyl)aminobenzene 5'-phosphate synthase
MAPTCRAAFFARTLLSHRNSVTTAVRPPTSCGLDQPGPAQTSNSLDKTVEIASDIYLISLVSDKPGTLELHELSLAIKAPNGMVLVVGCSHPGIDKIVEAASTIDPRIHLIVGGFHLVVASDADIQKIVTALHDTFKVQYVAPGHCTGEPAFTALKKAFGDRYLYAGLGTTFPLSTSPN